MDIKLVSMAVSPACVPTIPKENAIGAYPSIMGRLAMNPLRRGLEVGDDEFCMRGIISGWLLVCNSLDVDQSDKKANYVIT
jgi:hypothetical protein